MTRPPLPASWVDRIFDRMQGLYGSIWVDRWRTGETVDTPRGPVDKGVMVAKATWAQGLAGFADQPERLMKAIDACGSRPMPPTLPEFRDYARQAHVQVQTALPAPTPDAERRAANLERAASVSIKEAPGKAWAYRLRERYLRGERLLKCQIDLASAALEEVWKNGSCKGRTAE